MKNSNLPAMLRLAGIALVALLVVACETLDGGGKSLIGTSWVAEDIERRGVIDMLRSTISFDDETRVTGNGGCNRFFGPTKISGSKIEIGPLASTRMACSEAVMNQETRYLQALESVRTYRLDARTDLLYFYDIEGEPGGAVLRFSRLIGPPD
jgi:heat shock protein HslJ